jgi:hypothetical protein
VRGAKTQWEHEEITTLIKNNIVLSFSPVIQEMEVDSVVVKKSKMEESAPNTVQVPQVLISSIDTYL